MGKPSINRTTMHMEEPPKNIDGLTEARIEVGRAVRRLASHVKLIEDALEEDNSRIIAKIAQTVSQDATRLVGKASACQALINVRDGVFRVPENTKDN